MDRFFQQLVGTSLFTIVLFVFFRFFAPGFLVKEFFSMFDDEALTTFFFPQETFSLSTFSSICSPVSVSGGDPNS
jgi:hypothetical protein